MCLAARCEFRKAGCIAFGVRLLGIVVFCRHYGARHRYRRNKGASAVAASEPPRRVAGNSYGISQVAYINELLRKGWTEHGLSPSPPASDSEWCRRVYLDFWGEFRRPPSWTRFFATELVSAS